MTNRYPQAGLSEGRQACKWAILSGEKLFNAEVIVRTMKNWEIVWMPKNLRNCHNNEAIENGRNIKASESRMRQRRKDIQYKEKWQEAQRYDYGC